MNKQIDANSSNGRTMVKKFPAYLIYEGSLHRSELNPNAIGAIYYDQVEVLKLIFPDKDWEYILSSCGVGERTKGSVYDLNIILGNYFTDKERSALFDKLNNPYRLCQDKTAADIERICTFPKVEKYEYVIAGKKIFKILKELNIDIEGGLEIGVIPPKSFIVQNYKAIKGKAERIPRYLEVVEPLAFVTAPLTKLELENYRRKQAFDKQLRNL